MKLIAWMIQEIFRMLDQFAVEIPTLPVDQCLPPHPIPEGMPSLCKGMPSRREGPPSIWDTHGISGNVFCKSRCVIFSTLSAGIESREFQYRRAASFIHSGKEWEANTRSGYQRCQSGPSAKNSVIFSGGDSSKNYGADQRLQISDLHFDKFPTPATLACWKIRFKTEVCTCSQFPTEAMHWIKEVEMVDSVDDLISSTSIRGIQMPNFEVLDARISSALNRIIHNSHFKRKISLEEERPRSRTVSFAEDRLLTWSLSTSGTLEPMIPSRIMPTYSLLVFEMMIFRNSILCGTEFYLLSMTKIPPDDILEGVYKFRIRECEKPKTVLELYNMEIHQKKIGPDYHRLKTMVKRSIEQDFRNKNFGARNGNYERNAVVKNPGQNIVDKEFLEIVGNGSPTGSVLEETVAVSATISISVEKWHSRILIRILSCSSKREMRQEPEVPEERVPVVECLDGPARITSKELAPIHSVKSGTLQNACSTRPRVDVDWGKSALMRIARLKNSPAKGLKKNGDKSAVAMLKKNDLYAGIWQPVVNRDKSQERWERPDVNRDTCHELKWGPVRRRSSYARQLGCVFQDMKPPKSILRKSSDKQKPIQRVKFTNAIVRRAKKSRPKSFARFDLPRWTSSA